MKKTGKRERIKTLRRMLKIQSQSLQAMVARVDELNAKVRDTKAEAFDILRGKICK